MPGTRTLLRRLTPTLAALQLAAFAFVPAVESLFERSPGPVSVEAAHDRCAVVHQPATCPACALATARARPAERVHLAIAGDASVVAQTSVPSSGPSRAPPNTDRTRAPPSRAV